MIRSRKGAFMKKIPIRVLSFCMAISVTVSGCGRFNWSFGDSYKGSSTEAGKPDISVQKKFDQYVSDIFKEKVTDNGINLHYTLENPEDYGIKDQKKSLEPIDFDEIQQEKKQIQKERKRLQQFDRQKLSQSQQDTYDVLKDYLKTQEKIADFPYYTSVLGSNSGQQAQLLITFSEYRLREEKDIPSYFQMLSQVGDYFESLIRYEKERIKRGLFMSDEGVDRVIAQIEGFTKRREDNMLLGTFEQRIGTINGLDQKKKQLYIEKNRKIVQSKVIPAYEKLAQNLKNLKGNGKNTAGLYYLKSGRNYYEALVRAKTGSKRTVRDMVKDTNSNIIECMRNIQSLQSRYPQAVEEYINQDWESYVEKNPRTIIQKLKKKMIKYYPKAPKVNYQVKYVHASMEKDASPAFYMVPAIDAYKENVIYINKSQTDDAVSLYSTLAHEGYPGHLYQNVYYAAKKEAPIRYILNYPGYTEGWASYVEGWSYNTIETGADHSIVAELNITMYEYNLAICSRADFGIHYEGWKKEDTRNYLKKYGIDSSQANELFEIIVEDPANYLSYYIGYQEFQDLLSFYKKKAGRKYSLKAYHTMILDAGPCSFDILKKRIEKNL